MKSSDTLLVGFDHSHGDIAVLIIGRKDAGENAQIINQFQGKEAEELYKKLVGKEASDDDRLNLTVEHPTRLCVVHDEVGYFHMWEHYSKPIPASPFIGGEPAGVFSKVFGIVEFKDGVKRVEPTEIIFRDETTDILYQIDKDEEIRKRITQGPSVKGAVNVG